jgi:hypothetical protein
VRPLRAYQLKRSSLLLDHAVSWRAMNALTLRAAFRGKSAQMVKPDAAMRLSRYKVGGFSLFQPPRNS